MATPPPLSTPPTNDTTTNGSNTNHHCESSFVVNITRVQDSDGYIGTVRYVGTIPTNNKNNDNVYIGVEWDDATRGKHTNGTLLDATTGQYTTYFTTTTREATTTSCSFVKPHKVSRGRSLTMEILYEKYVPLESLECITDTLGYVGCKPVQFIGELHIRRYQQLVQLQSLALRHAALSTIHPSLTTTSISTNPHHSSLHHIVELDLAGNLFSSWQDSFIPILQHFPQLQRLSLANNRINDLLLSTSTTNGNGNDGDTDTDDLLWTTIFGTTTPLHTCLIHLNLQNTNIQSSIQTIQVVQTYCPNLQELILAGNPLQSLHVLPQESLRSLDASECHLHPATAAATAAAHVVVWPPNLTLLNLDGNPDFWHDTASLPPLPTSVETLQIAGGTMKHVRSLTQLHQWVGQSNVQRLRCDSSPYYSRLAVIGHVPQLIILNGGMVRKEERIAAGHYILRGGGDIVDNNDTNTNGADGGGDVAVIQALKMYWKSQLPDVTTTMSTTRVDDLQQARLVTLTFHCSMTQAAVPQSETITRNVPRSISMAALSKMVARHYVLDEESFQLYYLSNDGFPEVLESLESVTDPAQVMINAASSSDDYDDDNTNTNTNSPRKNGIAAAAKKRVTEEKIQKQEEERNRFLEQQKRLR